MVMVVSDGRKWLTKDKRIKEKAETRRNSRRSDSCRSEDRMMLERVSDKAVRD